MNLKIILVVFCSFCFLPSSGYKILLLPSGLETHQIMFSRVGEHLVKHGHQVTFLIGDKKTQAPDLKESGVEIRTFRMDNISFIDTPEMQSLLVRYAFSSSIMERWELTKIGLAGLEEEGMLIFKDKEAIKRLQEDKYDFALVDLPHYMLLSHKLSLPFAIFGLDAPHLIRRIPYMPSYVPMFTSDHSDEMTLGERFMNFLQFFLFDLNVMYLHGGTDLSRQVAPELPPISVVDLYQKASLFFKFNDIGFETPRPGMPDIVPAGHILVRPPKPLPGHVEEILTKSEGTILVSTGSMIRIFPDEVLSKFLRVFSQLQYDIILKHDQKIDINIPENVHILKRIPQNDILAHPKLKLFISDCGFYSVMEAIYNGVPVIGFPMIMVDQYSNAAFLRSRRYGKVMDISSFTESDLTENINEVISDKTFSDALYEIGQKIRDMQQNNISNPIFWINHVIKYGDRHLRTEAYNMPIYQYLMLDVIGLLIFFAASICIVIYPFLKVCLRTYKWSCLEYKDVGRIN